MIIGGVLFGGFAGLTYWFPKAFGFRLHEGWGKAAFWFSLVGFYVIFVPLYAAGLLGMTRRLQHYDVALWRPWMLAARRRASCIMAAALACQVIQLVVSIRRATNLRDVTGDPWDGRSLEWATASPPPPFNFAVLPQVRRRGAVLGDQAARDRDPADRRRSPNTSRSRCRATARPGSSPPSSATITGFALIWHIWWLVGLGLAARLCGLRVVRLARRRGIRDPGRGGRPHRPRAPARPRSEWLAQARRAATSEADRHERDRGLAATHGPDSTPTARSRRGGDRRRRDRRDRSRRGRARLQARDRRLRLLDLPAQRHHHVLRLLRGARGAADRDRRRSVRARAVQSREHRDRNRVPAGLELHLRPVGGRRPSARNQLWTQVSLLVTGLLGLASCCWRRTISPAWSAQARARSAAPSCRPSSPWSAATACMSAPGSCGWAR